MLEKIKAGLANYWTTLAAALYFASETVLALPDFHAMSTRELVLRGAKVAGISLIGILARDAKPQPK